MRIGGSGLVAADLIPSGGGVMRNQDLVAERDGVLVSPYVLVALVSAKFACMQLLNVAASGRRLLVDGIWFNGSTSVGYQLRSHNTALADDGGAWASINPGAAAGNAHVFSEALSALPGDLLVEWAKEIGSVTEYVSFPYPIMIDEDEGLVLTTTSTNRVIEVTFIGREV